MIKIDIKQSAEILDQIFEKSIIDRSKSRIEAAFDSMIQFKMDYEIEGCSDDEETDELFAEYGIWSSKDRAKFEFILTRQIRLDGEEEYYQVVLNLRFDSSDFNDIKNLICWSMDFKDLMEWRSEIEKKDAYLIAKEAEMLNHETTLDLT